MNTVEIQKILKSLNKCQKNKYVTGVFSADKLPKLFRKPAVFVTNTDKSHDPGTHWTAFYFPLRGKAEYFDSYGMKPIIKEFTVFLSKHHSGWVHNKMKMQSIYSRLCGEYCILFLYAKMRGNSMQSFQSLFSAGNSVLNDSLISDLFKRYINVSPVCQRNKYSQKCCSKRFSSRHSH